VKFQYKGWRGRAKKRRIYIRRAESFLDLCRGIEPYNLKDHKNRRQPAEKGRGMGNSGKKDQRYIDVENPESG